MNIMTLKVQNELEGQLCNALGLPSRVQCLELRFAVGERPSAQVAFLIDDEQLEKITQVLQEFKLVPK